MSSLKARHQKALTSKGHGDAGERKDQKRALPLNGHGSGPTAGSLSAAVTAGKDRRYGAGRFRRVGLLATGSGVSSRTRHGSIAGASLM